MNLVELLGQLVIIIWGISAIGAFTVICFELLNFYKQGLLKKQPIYFHTFFFLLYTLVPILNSTVFFGYIWDKLKEYYKPVSLSIIAKRTWRDEEYY